MSNGRKQNISFSVTVGVVRRAPSRPLYNIMVPHNQFLSKFSKKKFEKPIYDSSYCLIAQRQVLTLALTVKVNRKEAKHYR